MNNNKQKSHEWDALKNAREALGLTTRDLAEKSGLCQATVVAWEKAMPDAFVRLTLMAEALETTPSQLLGFQVQIQRDAVSVTPPIVSEALRAYRDCLYDRLAQCASERRDVAEIAEIAAKLSELDAAVQ